MNIFRTLLLSSLFLSGIAPSIADDLVSFDLVRQSSGSLEARMPYEVSTAIKEGDRLELVSADGYDFGLNVSKTTYSPLGNRIIHASTDSGGKAIIVADAAGGLLGSIQESGQNFFIDTDESGAVSVMTRQSGQRAKFIDESPRVLEPAKGGSFGISAEEVTAKVGSPKFMRAEKQAGTIYPEFRTGPADVSVLIYYDQKLSNPMSTIDLVIADTNESFSRSGVNVRISLAGTKSLSLGSDFNRPLAEKMDNAQSPFENIIEDRSFYNADLVLAIKSGVDPDDDYCGYAPYLGVYKGKPYRQSYVATVSWQPDRYYDYCPDKTFAHEVGHLLGGMHLKSEYSSPVVGAFSYSHGHEVGGVFATVMSSYYSGSNPVQQFSSPQASCLDYDCGVASESDMVKTLSATGHMVSGFEGDDFLYELVTAQRVEGEDYECERDGLSGYWEAHGIRNHTKYDLEIVADHFVRADGTSFISDYRDRIIAPENLGWFGWCVTADSPSSLKTEYVKSFTVFRNPVTSELVQLETLLWETDYDGEYRLVRVATGQGGSNSGHPSRSVRVGASEIFAFNPDTGYAVASIQSNCSGRQSGNSYTVDVGRDDCLVEASFQQVAADLPLRLSIETPAGGQTYSGIGQFQGWAVAQEGIDRVELYINDVFFQTAPYGGARGDVGNVFPDVPKSSESGFSLAYNYGNLPEGTHTLKAIAVTEDGRTLEKTATFSVAKFHKPFIGREDVVSLDGGYCQVQNDEVTVIDALIDGKSYDISLEWRTGTQGFEIYEIR